MKPSIFSSKENEQVSYTTDKTILLLLVQPDEHFEKREHGNAWLVLSAKLCESEIFLILFFDFFLILACAMNIAPDHFLVVKTF